MSNRPEKDVYKMSLFVTLVRRNHNCIRIEPNPKNEKFFIFIFEHTTELDKDLAELSGREYKSDEETEK